VECAIVADDDEPEKDIEEYLRRVSMRARPWESRLAVGKDHKVLATVANAMIILANDPGIAGTFGFNEFTSQHLLMRSAPTSEGIELPGPYPRPWAAEDVVLIQGYMQRVWSQKFTRSTVEDAIVAEASSHRFHPVVDWLDSLRWDGVKRLDNWLINTFDCENTDYVRAVAAKVLIAAVRRVRQPGCKFDYMLVLEGAQGIGKSESLRRLFGPDWFSDAIPPDLAGKDAAMALLGVWCLEFAEIEHLIRLEVETIKAFLSRSTDRFRPPYGRAFVERPRQIVLIGTTNSDDYLRDTSGNRRIWPVKCRTASPEWVSVNREQLWAEAVVREAARELVWLDDATVQGAAVEAQSDRMFEDGWHETVANWVARRDEVTIPDILTQAIDVPMERQDKRQQMRVGAILRRLGWKSTVRRKGTVTRRVWVIASNEGMDDIF
jgi:putative DNA primase/helicase